MSRRFGITPRTAIALFLLILLVIGFLVELVAFAPDLFAELPKDYDFYVQWGFVQRFGPDQYPFWLVNYYPLPTTLWVFVPLSFLPGWFAILWTVAPFLFTLWLLRRAGGFLWIYYPMLVQAAVGQLDGILLLPLYWLLENRPYLAGVGAVLMLFKPQLAFFTVLYAILDWIVHRNWRNLSAFAVTLTVIYLPAFIADPFWVLTMLTRMSVRANEYLLPTRGASLWAWIWHGGITFWLFPIVAALSIALAIYVFTVRAKRMQAVQLLGLLVMPILYAANFVTIIPILRTSRQVTILTLVSWAAVAIDTVGGGWGGAYVIIPITGLILLARESTEPSVELAQPLVASPQPH